MSVADLTGTSWKFDNTILPKSTTYSEFAISGTINTTHTFSGIRSPLAHYNYGAILAKYIDGGTFDDLIQNSNGSWSIYNNDDEYEVEALGNEITLEITGGADATNASVISFFETYGTNVTPAPTPSNKISIGSLPLSKMFVGNAEVSKAVLNGVTLYEKEAPSGYEVSITDSNNYSVVTIYDGADRTGTQIYFGFIGDGKTVRVTSGNLFIYPGLMINYDDTTTTGGVTKVSGSESGGILFAVTGDGTIATETWD